MGTSGAVAGQAPRVPRMERGPTAPKRASQSPRQRGLCCRAPQPWARGDAAFGASNHRGATPAPTPQEARGPSSTHTPQRSPAAVQPLQAGLASGRGQEGQRDAGGAVQGSRSSRTCPLQKRKAHSYDGGRVQRRAKLPARTRDSLQTPASGPPAVTATASVQMAPRSSVEQAQRPALTTAGLRKPSSTGTWPCPLLTFVGCCASTVRLRSPQRP